MSKEKIMSYLMTALEFTKMVAVITSNTAVKLVEEGKKEMLKQYTEYNQKIGDGSHGETLKGLTAAVQKAKLTLREADNKFHITATGKKIGHAIDKNLDKSTSAIADKIKRKK